MRERFYEYFRKEERFIDETCKIQGIVWMSPAFRYGAICRACLAQSEAPAID
jgi:hypothetical protein